MATEPQPDLPSEPSALSPEALKAPYGPLFHAIQQEWNKAEEAIKRSEQIALDVSIPAISELRYAGRRVIDALTLTAVEGDNSEKILALLEDARFCCHRAQHDAIDAALAKIGIDLDDLTSRLGFEAVTAAYPKFREFYAQFAVTRNKIAGSRANRTDRNAIYDAVTNVDLPAIIVCYEQIMVMRPIAKGHAFKVRLGSINGIILTIAAVAGVIFAGMAVDWAKWFPKDSPAVNSPPAAGASLSAS